MSDQRHDMLWQNSKEWLYATHSACQGRCIIHGLDGAATTYDTAFTSLVFFWKLVPNSFIDVFRVRNEYWGVA